MTIGSFLEKNRINDFINKYNMLEKGDGVVLGLSGGPDSVCLFFVLLELQKTYDLKLRAVHINHMIRVGSADEDERFVQQLCRKFDVELVVERIDIPARVKKTGRSVEEEARMARYEAFNEEAQRLGDSLGRKAKIAIAHNANDNAETVLFHMARGAGLDGMCGIAPVRGQIIRPLLKVSKPDIVAFLEEVGQKYCIDETNSDVEYDRNRIRHNIMPELNQVNERALEHISDMTESLQEVQSLIKTEADGLLAMAQEPEGRLRKRTIATAPSVIRTMALKTYLSRFMPDEKDVSKAHLDKALELLSGDGEKYVDLPHKKRLVISYEDIFVMDLPDKDGPDLEPEWHFSFREFTLKEGAEYPKSAYTKWFDCDKITQDIATRTRKEGDYLTINSEGGTKLLKDYFINEKIPQHQRDCIPLLCDGSHVMWVVGHRISEYYKITDETTRVLEVSFMEEKTENE